MKPSRVRFAFAFLLTVLITCGPVLAGLDSKKAMYVGGTLTDTLPGLKENTEGDSRTTDEKVFVFEYMDGKMKQSLKIPYDRVDSLEYGQKAGRRVGLAIAVTPLALLSKKRRHFLTIGYTDEQDKQQAAVFELGKGIVRVTLATMEARTGRKIEYQDEEARNSSKGN